MIERPSFIRGGYPGYLLLEEYPKLDCGIVSLITGYAHSTDSPCKNENICIYNKNILLDHGTMD
jgi:hypothetical protein